MATQELGEVVQLVAGSQLHRSLILALVICLAACGSDGERDIFAGGLKCPPPSVVQVEPWGESGSQQICKIKHGPFVASEGGYIHLRGNFHNGKKSGVWKWYDRAGTVIKEVDYDKAADKWAEGIN